jgi:hypothetical protein
MLLIFNLPLISRKLRVVYEILVGFLELSIAKLRNATLLGGKLPFEKYLRLQTIAMVAFRCQ